MLQKLFSRFRQAVITSSRSSRIFFALTAAAGILYLLSGFHLIMLLVTGLMGVLWLSSIALHSVSDGRARRVNPFTWLIFLCAAVAAFTFIYARSGPNYNRDNEPIELMTREIQEFLNSGDEDFEHLIYYADFVLQTLDHNLIVTDENDQVIYAINNWRTAGSTVFYPLTVSTEGMVVFLGENEQVMTTALRESAWVDERFLRAQSPLTRTDAPLSDENKADQAETFLTRNIPAASDEPSAAPQPTAAPAAEIIPSEPALTDRERLTLLYFPDFGQYINDSFYSLAYEPLMLSSETDPERWTHLYIRDWQGETIIGRGHEEAQYSSSYLRNLVSELNALTKEQRESLKEYIAWYESAREAARSDGEYIRVRLLKSEDGTRNAYLIYEYDYNALYPLQVKHSRDNQHRAFLANFAVFMIPAIIVFLAFWVFVDARRRGQSHPALWAVLTLIGNIVAWIVYMMTRPQMTLTLSGKAAPKGMCPLCGTKLQSDFIACPGCGILLRSRCKNCGHALENDWSFCPYCASAVASEQDAPAAEPPTALPSEEADSE